MSSMVAFIYLVVVNKDNYFQWFDMIIVKKYENWKDVKFLTVSDGGTNNADGLHDHGHYN